MHLGTTGKKYIAQLTKFIIIVGIIIKETIKHLYLGFGYVQMKFKEKVSVYDTESYNCSYSELSSIWSIKKKMAWIWKLR